MTEPLRPAAEQAEYVVTAEICGRTEVGPVRTDNQDAIAVLGAVGLRTGTRLFWSGTVPAGGIVTAVIDGMGGYAGGADAAALAAGAFATAELSDAMPSWDGYFTALSERIALAGRAWGTPSMGAAAALVQLTSTGVTAANAGDCRIYRISGGRLGLVSVDDRTDDPSSHIVTQALGGSTRIDSHTWRQPYQGGPERYLLCSDGVWGTLSRGVLRDLSSAERPAEDIADAIIASIYAQNADDNCSVVVVDLTAAPLDSRREELRLSGRRTQPIVVQSATPIRTDER